MPPSLIPSSFVEKKKLYSWKEISVHNSLDDCWIVVQGKVYDVTHWVPKHPGGHIIGLAAGREASALVYSYHPYSVFDILSKYYIGEVSDYESYYTYESLFYKTMKDRVTEYMKQHKMTRTSNLMYLKSIFVLSFYFLFYYLSLVKGYVPLAIMFGFFHAEMGFNIMHDGCHGAYSSNHVICRLAARTMELMGSSSIVWQYQHNVGHHPYANVAVRTKAPSKLDPLAFDPDAVAGDPMVRINPNLSSQWHQQFQHVYIWILITLNNFKWFINDIRSLVGKKYKDIDFGAIPKGELEILVISKIIFVTYAFLLPIYLHGYAGVLMCSLFMMTSGFVSIIFFGVNHLTDDAEFPNESQDANQRDWAKLQVATASNFANSSLFWTTITGSLNFQIEHHLFPGINQMHLPAISPIVYQTCKEFGVPYHSFPSFWSALYAYYIHLKHLGNPTTAVTVDNKKK